MNAILTRKKSHLIMLCCKAGFLSTFFIFLYSAQCHPVCDEAAKNRKYLDLYDEVVNLYFKPPYEKQRAVAILDQSCQCNPDHQDMSCYNSGVLHELRGENDLALESYKKAQKIAPLPHYLLAIQNLEAKNSLVSSNYNYLADMVDACKKKDSRLALKILKKATKNKSLDNRQQFAQPYFQECMQKEKDYERILESIPQASTTQNQLTKQYYQEMARIHPLNSIFDIELYLTNQMKTGHSHRNITKTWQGFMQASRQGNAKEAYQKLQSLDREFTKTQKNEFRKTRAVRRAIYLLVTQDPAFQKVSHNASIQRLLIAFR